MKLKAVLSFLFAVEYFSSGHVFPFTEAWQIKTFRLFDWVIHFTTSFLTSFSLFWSIRVSSFTFFSFFS